MVGFEGQLPAHEAAELALALDLTARTAAHPHGVGVGSGASTPTGCGTGSAEITGRPLAGAATVDRDGRAENPGGADRSGAHPADVATRRSGPGSNARSDGAIPERATGSGDPAGVDDAGAVARPDLDERRVDALLNWARAALADPHAPTLHGRRAEIQVTVDLPTLLGLAEHPAELEGYGPLPPSVAPALAGDGRWRRLVTDPVTGHTLDYGTRVYAPPQDLRDYVTARDRTCVFPGCARPARRCDLDHGHPHAEGGATSSQNMRALCRRHHRLKTHHGWNIQAGPNATTIWTSPTGHVYRTQPPDQRPAILATTQRHHDDPDGDDADGDVVRGGGLTWSVQEHVG